MNRYSIVLAAVVCGFVMSCAPVPTKTASIVPDEQIQVTGSRLSVKDRASTSSSVTTIDNQSDIGGMMQRANPNNMPPMGGGR